MSQIQVFIEGLQKATGNTLWPIKFWGNYPENDVHTFQDALAKYAEYYSALNPAQKKAMSIIFWAQIEAMGTPIIEDSLGSDGECAVYFLFPKDKLVEGKELYLQGDFHGYGSTDGTQVLTELSDTGIMLRADNMPVDAIVVYSYIQVEPRYGGKKPAPERAPFFNEAFAPTSSKSVNFPEIRQIPYKDEYSKHISPYPGFDNSECAFRVSAESNQAHISGKPVDWPSLLSTEAPSHSGHFLYHATLYSDQAGDLHRSEAQVTEKYNDDLFYSNGYHLSLKVVPSFDALDTNKLGETPYLIKDEVTGSYKIWGCHEGAWQLTNIDSKAVPPEWEQKQSVFVSVTDAMFNTLKQGHTPYLPYASFTRGIHVFKSASGQVDDIIVINDGIPYLIAGILDHFEKMVHENQLSPHTALVFVNTLPGLKKTLFEGSDEAKAFDQDPSVNLDGMGERLIDYKHGIDQYIDFIANKLFPQLKNEINVPEDPGHRVMIGASLSGTASVYIGSKHPELFGAVIAQSPSPDNRAILSRIPSEMRTRRNIHLSCGEFEHPDYAASNANLEYAQELRDKLNIPLHVGAHGHQFIAWNEVLEHALPEILLQALIQDNNVVGASVAVLNHGKIKTVSAGKLVRGGDDDDVTPNAVFEAASLSKPVFAYIVLKIVEDGKFSRPGEAPESGLERPLHEICDFGPPELRDHPNYKLLTPRNLLSHQASLPNWFKPGEPEAYVGAADVVTVKTRFDYSGLAYCFLNEVVEHIAGKPLDELSREVFDDESLEMNHTSFVPFPEESDKQTKRAVGHKADGSPDKRAPSLPIRANPAASLVTTAEDYAKFLNTCLHDDFIRTHMFEPQLNLAGKDQKAIDAKVSEETLRQISWGIGMGLQTGDNGDPIAFHWGDNETSRAFTAINLRTNEAVACFTNSANGPAVFRQVAELIVGSIEPITTWLRNREKLNVSVESFTSRSDEERSIQCARNMKGALEAIKSEEIDLSVSSPTVNTPGMTGSK